MAIINPDGLIIITRYNNALKHRIEGGGGKNKSGCGYFF